MRFHLRSTSFSYATSSLAVPANQTASGLGLLWGDAEAAAAAEALTVPWDTKDLLSGPPARLARLYLAAARPAEALELRLRHLAIAEAAGDAASAAAACKDVAVALRALGRDGEASDALSRCSAHARQLQPSAAAAAAMHTTRVGWGPMMLSSDLVHGGGEGGGAGLGPAASAALIQAAWAHPDGLSYHRLNEEARCCLHAGRCSV